MVTACKLGTSLGINVNDFLYDSTLVENLVFDQVKMDIEENKIVSAWFNTYEEGDFQELHEHNANIIVERGLKYTRITNYPFSLR